MKVIRKIGNEELLNREKTLFLCSKRTPYTLNGRIFQWVESLTNKTKRAGVETMFSIEEFTS